MFFSNIDEEDDDDDDEEEENARDENGALPPNLREFPAYDVAFIECCTFSNRSTFDCRSCNMDSIDVDDRCRRNIPFSTSGDEPDAGTPGVDGYDGYD